MFFLLRFIKDKFSSYFLRTKVVILLFLPNKNTISAKVSSQTSGLFMANRKFVIKDYIYYRVVNIFDQ